MQLPSKTDLLSVYQQVSSKVKQYAKNLSVIELKVEEATSNEPWGPHGTAMAEITKAAYDYENYKQIMGVVARRLQSEGESWRHVYKSLLLLEYMCKHGPQKVVSELSGNIGTVEKLERFQYKDKNGKDWGMNVRHRAKELSSLVTSPAAVQRERQKAKENAAKYTGVSSDESRMGGFGGSNSGFSNTSSNSLGGSALGGMNLGKSKGSSLTGFGNGDSMRSSRYDDDIDVDHQSLTTEDLDDVTQDSKQATRKRIESLKKSSDDSPGRKARASPFKASKPPGAVEAEQKAPKKLSQIKVDPSIAKSLAGLSRGPSPAPGPTSSAVASQTPAATDMLDLLGNEAPATDPKSTATNDTWGAFGSSSGVVTKPVSKGQSDDWADLLDGPSSDRTSSHAPPFGGPAGAPASSAPTSAHTADPFAPRTAMSTASADPFSISLTDDRKAVGTLPLAPTPRKADQDPFAILTSAAAGPHQALEPKPQSPLKSMPVLGNRTTAASFLDPFAYSGSPATTSQSPAVPPSSKIGQALPEDIFAAASSPASGSNGAFRNQVNTPANQSGGHSRLVQPSLFAQQSQDNTPSRAAQSMQGFSAFGSTQQNTEDLFGSMSMASPNASSRNAEALGGGTKMAPSLAQPNLPPPVNKQDPFAGLAGF